MKVLLLGATGQIGTALMKSAHKYDVECIGYGRESFDISHPDEVERLIDVLNPDILVNSVALQAIDKCEQYPDDAFRINATAVSNLAKICQKREIIIVQLGTHTIFDGASTLPYVESDCPNPLNIYGMSKLAGDLFALNICCRSYVFRLPTVFGKRIDGYNGFCDKLLDWIKALQPLQMAVDKIDSFGFADDISDEIFRVILNGMNYGIYHITNSDAASYYEFAQELLNGLGFSEYPIESVTDSTFSSLGRKPLRTPIASEKLPPLRSWKEAMSIYISQLKEE